MYILGINCAYHESSVALIQVNGEEWDLLSFVEEERFNRKKRAKPALADNADRPRTAHPLPCRAVGY